MANFTSNTYQMKRKILTFTNKISNQVVSIYSKLLRQASLSGILKETL